MFHFHDDVKAGDIEHDDGEVDDGDDKSSYFGASSHVF